MKNVTVSQKLDRVIYAHPEEWTLCWTGKGRRPKWVSAWLLSGGTYEQLEHGADACRAYAAASGDKGLAGTAEKTVTVTNIKKLSVVQDQLPGLPSLPKKRGRPVTGGALTPAQRKAKSRSNALDVVCSDPAKAGITALLETYSSMMSSSMCLNNESYVVRASFAVELAKELVCRAEARLVDLKSSKL